MFRKFWHDFWIVLFIVLVFIGIFSGKGMVIGLASMGLFVAGIAWLWNKLALEELDYIRVIPQNRVFRGEKVHLSIEISNRKPIPLPRLDIDDDIPDSLKIEGADVGYSPNPNSTRMRHSTSISWYEKTRWDYRISGSKRGYFRIGPATLTSGDIFGLFQNVRQERSRDYLLVYPNIVDLPSIGLPEARPLGDAEGGIRMFQDPSRPSGIRDYQRGDPMKTIDWKATAKMGDLKVRTFEPSSSQTIILLVAVETTLRFWEGYSAVNLERVITAAASVASYVSEKRYSLGMFSNGTPILADRPMKIPPTGSEDQLTIILEALATIRPLPMGPMPVNLAENIGKFPIGSTLVITAALITDEFVEVIRRLLQNGHKIVVLYVADGNCPDMPERVTLYEIGHHFQRMEMSGEFASR